MNWLLVAFGGAIGASFRYGAGVWFLKPSGLFPWTTWWVNILGCFLVGVFFAFTQKYEILQNETRLFFMVGILGGFTTFSSFGLETFQLLKQGHFSIAFTYIFSSLVVGIFLLGFGFYMIQFIFNHK